MPGYRDPKRTVEYLAEYRKQRKISAAALAALGDHRAQPKDQCHEFAPERYVKISPCGTVTTQRRPRRRCLACWECAASDACCLCSTCKIGMHGVADVLATGLV